MENNDRIENFFLGNSVLDRKPLSVSDIMLQEFKVSLSALLGESLLLEALKKVDGTLHDDQFEGEFAGSRDE